MRKTSMSKIYKSIPDGSLSVTRSSSGQIWVNKWDSYSGKRGQNVVFKELSKSDQDEMIKNGILLSSDQQIIDWITKQVNQY